MSDYEPTELIFVDTETNGLDPERHDAVEIGWENIATGETGCFVPRHNPREILAAAEPEALQVNRYVERGLWRPSLMDNGPELQRLWEQFGGSIHHDPDPDRLIPRRALVAVNPAFDASFIAKAFARGFDPNLDLEVRPWHYRMENLGSIARGAFRLPIDHPPLSFREVCERLDVEIGDHTAGGDVRAGAECLRLLARLVDVPCTGRCNPDARTDGECDCPLREAG
jgi:DNA polymerase III epsilon subunit-like protein